MVNPKLRYYLVPRIRMQGITATTSWIAENCTPEVSIISTISASALLYELSYSAPNVPYVIYIYDKSALTDQEYEAGVKALKIISRELGFKIELEFSANTGWMSLPDVLHPPNVAPLVYTHETGLSECFKGVDRIARSTGSNPTLNAMAALFWAAIEMVRCANLQPFDVFLTLLKHDVDNPYLEEYIDLKVDVMASYILGEISETCRKRFMFSRIT